MSKHVTNGLCCGYCSSGVLRNNLRANALVGEYFQQNRVLHASVDHVDLPDAGLDCLAGAVEFWNHPAGDNAVRDQLVDFGAVDGGDKGFWIGGNDPNDEPNHAEHVCSRYDESDAASGSENVLCGA